MSGFVNITIEEIIDNTAISVNENIDDVSISVVDESINIAVTVEEKYGIDGKTPVKGVDYVDGAQGIQGIQGIQGSPGVGVPTGGTINQVLIKNSNDNYDTKWNDPSGGLTQAQILSRQL